MLPEKIDPPALAHRLFFALLPPADVDAELADLASVYGPGGRVGRGRHHLTLTVTDDYPWLPDELVDRFLRTGATLDGPRVEVFLDRICAGPKSVLLTSSKRLDSLRLMQRQLARTLRLSGVRPRGGFHFHPHVTLLYAPGHAFEYEILPLRWTARELVLVHSHVGAHRHDVLGRWELG